VVLPTVVHDDVQETDPYPFVCILALVGMAFSARAQAEQPAFEDCEECDLGNADLYGAELSEANLSQYWTAFSSNLGTGSSCSDGFENIDQVWTLKFLCAKKDAIWGYSRPILRTTLRTDSGGGAGRPGEPPRVSGGLAPGASTLRTCRLMPRALSYPLAINGG